MHTSSLMKWSNFLTGDPSSDMYDFYLSNPQLIPEFSMWAFICDPTTDYSTPRGVGSGRSGLILILYSSSSPLDISVNYFRDLDSSSCWLSLVRLILGWLCYLPLYISLSISSPLTSSCSMIGGMFKYFVMLSWCVGTASRCPARSLSKLLRSLTNSYLLTGDPINHRQGVGSAVPSTSSRLGLLIWLSRIIYLRILCLFLAGMMDRRTIKHEMM